MVHTIVGHASNVLEPWTVLFGAYTTLDMLRPDLYSDDFTEDLFGEDAPPAAAIHCFAQVGLESRIPRSH